MRNSVVILCLVLIFGCAHKESMENSQEQTAQESQEHGGQHHEGGEHHGHHGGHQHGFKDAKKWAKAFDDPSRDQWQKPDVVLKNLPLQKSKCIADIGAGTGYFSTKMAHAAPKTHVYAIDIEQDMVDYLKTRGEKEGLKNHIPLKSDETFPTLPEKCDLLLTVDTYHHLSDRILYFKNLRNQLSPKAEVAIVDFTKESPIGPKKEHRLDKELVKNEMQTAGFRLSREVAGLPHQYFLIFSKN
ncbi:MAG: class I SAM-dependent methyltransferase [Bdellovibrionaceae bacterium]|nr:class I SAM-dependent methyltransferase [Pseudobdellovibrionaceae bacterium]